MARARDINEEMKIAAAEAIAGLITDEERKEDYVIVPAFDKRVGKAVADAGLSGSGGYRCEPDW